MSSNNTTFKQVNSIVPTDVILKSQDDVKLQQDQLNHFKGYDHITFYVGSAKLTAHYIVQLLGFEHYCHATLETNSKMVTRYVVKKNNIILQFISGTRGVSKTIGQGFIFSDEEQLAEIYEHITKHGDSVKDVAFQVDDVHKVYDHAVNIGGCIGINPPSTYEDDYGCIVIAKVTGIGDTVHTLVDRSRYRGFLPNCFLRYNDDVITDSDYTSEEYVHIRETQKMNNGFDPITPDDSDHTNSNNSITTENYIDELRENKLPTDLISIDHCVQNVDWDNMIEGVEFYQKAFGFHVFWSVDDKQVYTHYSALRSTVMASMNNTVKMPINEPAKGLKRSQIEEFIEFHNGPGVQHIALSTNDIIATITNMKERGVDFISVPDIYYDKLIVRLRVEHGPKIEEPIEKLRKLGILIDFDEHGYLLQLFTRPIFDRPTLFLEIIQRHNHNGFGAGNFKSLFEVLELDQKKRGNLTDQFTPLELHKEIEESIQDHDEKMRRWHIDNSDYN